MRILLKSFSAITLADPPVLDAASFCIEDGLITGIYLDQQEIPPLKFDVVFDGHKKLVLPGFVNAHTHLAMTLLRGFADDLPLMRWLKDAIWPMEAQLTPDEIYWGAQLGMAEMIRSGTTAFADMYFHMDRVAEAAQQSGMRALLGQALFASSFNESAKKMLAASKDFAEQVDALDNPNIRAALAPHAPYTVAPEVWRRVTELALEKKIPIHTHLAETHREIDDALRDWGISPVEHLESLGVFEARTLAAHCVHLSARDFEILANHNINVIHNPTSNLKLASGFAPVQRLLRCGVNVAIGTDGAASNNNLDMLEEIRLATLIQKGILEDATAMPAIEALRAGTERGARALGWGGAGVMDVGRDADLIILDIDKPHWVPGFDLASNLVYSAQAADVQTVIIAGKVVMKNRELKALDEEKAKAKIEEFQRKHRRR